MRSTKYVSCLLSNGKLYIFTSITQYSMILLVIPRMSYSYEVSLPLTTAIKYRTVQRRVTKYNVNEQIKNLTVITR